MGAGFDIAPLQAEWARDRLGLDASQLLADLLLLLNDGRVIRGADVYRYLMRRIGWAYPLWALSMSPGLRAIFDAGYRVFARNRYCVSHACRLDHH